MRNVLDWTQRLRFSLENHVRNEFLSDVSDPSSRRSARAASELLVSTSRALISCIVQKQRLDINNKQMPLQIFLINTLN